MIVLPLEENNFMTSWMLALALMEHLPDMARDKITSKMIRRDREPAKEEEELTNRNKLMNLAREEEACVLNKRQK